MTRIHPSTLLSIALAALLASGITGCGGRPATEEGHDDPGHAPGEHGDEGADAHADEHGDEHADEPGDEHAGEEMVVHLEESEFAGHGIELATAGPGTIAIELELPGEVTLDADRLGHTVPRMSGIVTAVQGSLGQQVSRGQALVVVRSQDLATAKAGYRAALSRRGLAQQNFDREALLREKGITSEQDYLDAKQALDESNIELQLAEQTLHALGLSESQVERLAAGHGMEDTSYTITAPLAGTIIEKHVSIGEVVEPGAELFLIADLSQVWAQLTVTQRDLALVRPGQSVTIVSQTGERASATIDFISGMVEGATRSASARVTLANPEGHWRPGQFVTGFVAGESTPIAVAVDAGAIQTLENAPHIFVRTEEGFEARAVTIGRTSTTVVEVLEGLESGEEYAATGTFLLKAEIGKGEAEHVH